MYMRYACEQACWALSAGNSAMENVCIIIVRYYRTVPQHEPDLSYSLLVQSKLAWLFGLVWSKKGYFCCINVDSTAIWNLHMKALHIFYIFQVNLSLHLGPSPLNYPFTFCSSLNPVTHECKHFLFLFYFWFPWCSC